MNNLTTRTFYHGTKHDVEEVMNNPMMKPSANGYGLYLTESLQAARAYGDVIAFVLPIGFEFDVIRKMEHMAWNAHEFVINDQATWVKFMKTMEDCYPEPYATPF